MDSFPSRRTTFERIETPTGRIFLLSEPRTMYWMQDALDEKDDEVVVQVNQYLTNPQEAAPEGSATNASLVEPTMPWHKLFVRVLEKLPSPSPHLTTTTTIKWMP